MKIKSVFTYDHKEHPGQTFTLPSETVPDMSYSIRELLARFTAGTMPPVARDVYYEENPDINNPDPVDSPNFDIVDAYELRDKLRADYLRRGKSKSAQNTVADESEAKVSESVDVSD